MRVTACKDWIYEVATALFVAIDSFYLILITCWDDPVEIPILN